MTGPARRVSSTGGPPSCTVSFRSATQKTRRETWSCGAVWSARHPVKVEAAGSNPVRTASEAPYRSNGAGLSRARTNPRPQAAPAAQPQSDTANPVRTAVKPRVDHRHGAFSCAPAPPHPMPSIQRSAHPLPTPQPLAPPEALSAPLAALTASHSLGTPKTGQAPRVAPWRRRMAASVRHETRALLRAHLSAASSYGHATRHCPICHRLLRLALDAPAPRLPVAQLPTGRQEGVEDGSTPTA